MATWIRMVPAQPRIMPMATSNIVFMPAICHGIALFARDGMYWYVRGEGIADLRL